MLIEEKKSKIMQTLIKKSSVTVSELSKTLNSSEVTIRKILNDLDKNGYLKRTRGGAVLLSNSLQEFPQNEKEQKSRIEKEAIAKKAYELIVDGDSVFLDAGSTTLRLVQLIKKGKKRNIIVITNALNIAAELVDIEDIELIIIGGVFRHKIQSCIGPITENALESFYFEKVFLGTNAISVEKGLTTPNIYEAQVKKSMIKSSKKTYVLADFSKFNKTSMSQICEIDEIDCVITDWNVSSEIIDGLKEKGTAIIQVER